MFKSGITSGEITTTTSMRLHSFCSILLVGLIGLVLPALMGGRRDDCARKTKMNLTHLPRKAPTTPVRARGFKGARQISSETFAEPLERTCKKDAYHWTFLVGAGQKAAKPQ